MLAPKVVIGDGSEQPTEPQPTSSTTPQEILTKVATAIASQPPKDPNTYMRTKRGRNTKVPQSGGSPKKVGDEAINEEMFDSVERAITTDAMQHRTVIRSLRPNPRQHLMSLILREKVQVVVLGAKKPWGVLLLRLAHPMIHLSQEVLGLEKEKDAQAVEILRLKKKVKRLARQRKSNTSQPRRRKYRQVESSDDDLDEEDASKQGMKNDKTIPMLHESDFDGFDNETVDVATTGVSTASAPVTTAGVAISTTEPRTPPTTPTIFDDEDVTMAMAQTLIKIKEEKAKEKGVAFKDVEDSSRPVRSITTL
ncbi:hypothetical protein Tco_0980014 [Tanacetum coccineum]